MKILALLGAGLIAVGTLAAPATADAQRHGGYDRHESYRHGGYGHGGYRDGYRHRGYRGYRGYRGRGRVVCRVHRGYRGPVRTCFRR